MRRGNDLLLRALQQGEALHTWSLPAWDDLIRQARPANLLARIGALVDDAGSAARIPPAPRAHLEAALTLARKQAADVRREVRHITQALQTVGTPVILLKGAAYVMAGHSPSRGRMFSDVDILVPKAHLGEVEAALMLAGWATTHHTAYDQRYYRRWMHELPPMQHIQRLTVIDVHHAILPDTARLKPDSARLIAASVPLDGEGLLRVLEPADMVLHSMTHLLHNDELSNGLRDLSDLDLLLREFSSRPGFWARLGERAQVLDLARPLYYGLRLTQALLGTPVPASATQLSVQAAPAWPLSAGMDGLWTRALGSHHPEAQSFGTPPALFMLYLRAHWLRMPPALLAGHLGVKAFRRVFPADEASAR
jgi:Uncharacterised nucleotidyltransferase